MGKNVRYILKGRLIMTTNPLSVLDLSYQTLWQRIFPLEWMRDLVHRYALDLWMKKLFFRPFISFLVMCCLLETGRLASRDLAMYSRQVKYQQVIGIPCSVRYFFSLHFQRGRRITLGSIQSRNEGSIKEC